MNERRTMLLRLVFGLVALVACGQLCPAQQPGDAPSLKVQARIRQLQVPLAASMNERDLQGVHTSVKAISSTLGSYAGIPETPESYVKPIDISQPNLETLESLWRSTFKNMLPSQGAYSALASENKLELRESAYIALACFAAAENTPTFEQAFVKRAIDEVDYLLERQAENGLFPYPVDPGGRAPANVRAMAEKARIERPDAVRDGYLYLDIPDMQFDVSCCGVAMCAAYGSTGKAVYLESARKAGQWAIAIPMSSNWNYNAFSVWLLANVFEASGEKEYLEAALDKVRFGVLPGLMENGRWVDQHNAKQSYHFIMVRALSDLVAVMPEDHLLKKEIACKLTLAAESRAKDIVNDGVSNIASAMWGLSTFVNNQGTSEICEKALNGVVNTLQINEKAKLERLLIPFYLQAAAQRTSPVSTIGEYNPQWLQNFSEDTWPGRMPKDMATQLEDLLKALEKAMNESDERGIQFVVAQLTKQHGRFAGVPEAKPTYSVEPDFSEPDIGKVIAAWSSSFLRMKGKNAFETAPQPEAEFQTGHRLRVSLRHGRAYLQTNEAGLDPNEEYKKYALKAFDYLVSAQASVGVFGYPYDPKGKGLKQHASRLVLKGQALGIKMVENGWIIEDLDDGGLQFDNGIVGWGSLYAYVLTNDSKYFDAALRAGEWAVKRPLVANWNYNCFSGQLLSRLYRITRNPKWLEAARMKFEYGVLPGQLSNGRWVDQHNAKIQYHSVMMRALIEYYLALTEAEDNDAARIADIIGRGLDNLSLQIMTYGASNVHELISLDSLCIGLSVFGPNDRWEAAINVNINALMSYGLPELEKRGFPMTETIASWLLYKKFADLDGRSVEITPSLSVPRRSED